MQPVSAPAGQTAEWQTGLAGTASGCSKHRSGLVRGLTKEVIYSMLEGV